VAGALLLTLAAIWAGGCGQGAPVATVPGDGASTTAPASTSTLRTSISTVPSATTATIPNVTVSGGLSLEGVRNAEVTVEYEYGKVTYSLVDGVAKAGVDPENPSERVDVPAAVSDLMAFDDLDGDGQGDAVVMIGAGPGATSADAVAEGGPDIVQCVVALLSKVGQPVQAGYYRVGAGATVGELSSDDGDIAFAAFVPQGESPGGASQTLITGKLRLSSVPGVGLLLTDLRSETPAGQIRVITMTSPEPGATVGASFTLRGTVTIAPFENNLELQAFTADMTEVALAPVTVVASELGGPGTFEVTVTMPHAGITGPVFVTVTDRSAVDGSVMALASVQVVVK
jgi:hypothetical protein